MDHEINKYKNLLDGPSKLNSLELIDSLVKRGMSEAHD